MIVGRYKPFLKGIRVILQQRWHGRGTEFRRLLRFVVAAVLIWEALPLVSVYAETHIVPWGRVVERYDSNIWQRPKGLLGVDAQGNAPQLHDFVTTVSGGLALLHESRDIDARLRVGGNYNKFVYNSPLDFYGASVNGTVGLDRWVDQYFRGARLRITERLSYSPEQSFGASMGGDLLETGLVTFRRSRIRSITTFEGSYPLSRDLSLEGGYQFSLRRQTSRTEGGDVTGATFFNTMTHTWHGGPRYQLTQNDSIAALYRQTFITQERSSSGGTFGRTFSTNIITIEGDYTKVFPEWQFAVRGGVTFVEPVGRSFPSGSIQVTTQPERDTVLNLMLARQATPSFFLQGGARISNLAQATISHRIYERLSVSASGQYTLSQFFPNTSSQFQFISGTSRLEYKLTRNIRGEIYYLFNHINTNGAQLEYQVSRHQVGFMLSVLLESLGMESLGLESLGQSLGFE